MGVIVCGGFAVVASIAGCTDDDCTVTLTCPPPGSGGSSSGGSAAGGSAQGGNTGGTGGDALAPNGTACSDGTTCASGICVDDLCCDAVCDGTCEACDVSGLEGTCSPHAPATDPDSDCTPGLCDGAGQCAVGDQVWGAGYTGSGSITARGVAVGSSGDVYVCGSYRGSNLSPDGTATTFATSATAGQYSSDIFAVRYDADGGVTWAQSHTPSIRDEEGNRCQGVAVDPDGDVILVGAFSANGAPTTFPGLDAGSNGGLFVAKLSALGNHLWSSDFSTSSSHGGDVDITDNSAIGVATDPQGNIIVGGIFNDDLDFGGSNVLSNAYVNQGFVASVDTDGAYRWATAFDGPGTLVFDVAIGAGGHIWAVGTFSQGFTVADTPLTVLGLYDGFAVRLDPATGAPVAALAFGGSDGDEPHGIAVDADGNALITGEFRGTATFAEMHTGVAVSNDIFVMKVGVSGAPIWSRAFGTTGEDSGHGVATDDVGNMLFYGYLGGDFDFGLGTVSGPASFAVKLSGDGTTVWSKAVPVGASSRITWGSTGGIAVSPVASGEAAGRIHLAGGIAAALNP